MEKHYFNYISRFVSYLLAASVAISPLSAIADCQCYYCDIASNDFFNDFDDEDYEEWAELEDADFEMLEEYEEDFREFVEEVDASEDFEYIIESYEKADDGTVQMRTFVGKWCKNLKSWFKRTVHSMLKSMINYKKYKDPERCSYEMAKFKRKLDRYFKTPSFPKLAQKFMKKTKDHPQMKLLIERAQYYYDHKHEKPVKILDRNMSYNMTRPEPDGALADIPDKALIGGISIFAGCLLIALPEPTCKGIGCSLVVGGIYKIEEAYSEQYPRNRREDY